MFFRTSIITAFILGLIFAGVGSLYAQDKSPESKDKKAPEFKIDKKFTLKALNDLLDLKDYQTTFIKNAYKEAQERYESEAESMQGDKTFLKRLSTDLQREAVDRIREVLSAEQLVTFEKYFAKEKQRRAEIEHPEDGVQTKDPGDPDKPE